jgi:hypothetical protein
VGGWRRRFVALLFCVDVSVSIFLSIYLSTYIYRTIYLYSFSHALFIFVFKLATNSLILGAQNGITRMVKVGVE